MDGLLPALFVRDDGLGALAGEAVDGAAGFFVRGAVSGTVVCGGDAGLETSVADW